MSSFTMAHGQDHLLDLEGITSSMRKPSLVQEEFVV
jgi:hypothetical protein